MLGVAAAVEVHSQHSIAKGIVSEAKKRGLEIPKARNFKSYPGKGAEGWVGAELVVVGNAKLMDELGINIVSKFKSKSKVGTLVYVAKDKELLGLIILEDEIREESKDAIDKLHKT